MMPTAVYRVDQSLIEALDGHLGPPLDSYVRGWQVWLEPNGPRGETLEWRLHPPARFAMPGGVDPHDLFDVVLQGLAEISEPGEAFKAGDEHRALGAVWEVLEVFPAFPDERSPVDPPALVEAAAAALGGRRADVAGHVDHQRLGDLWKGKRGDFSVGAVLLETLEPVAR